MFRNPDWVFLTILFICLLFIGGITFFLSLREISETTSQKEIIQIQDRYARLVLNIPAKVIKKVKKKELPPIKKKIEKKEKPTKKIEKKVEKKKVIEKKKVTVIPKAPKLPEIKIKAISKYKIKKKKINLEAEEKKIDFKKNELPDISMKASRKYKVRDKALDIDFDSKKKINRQLASKAPEINIGSSNKYNMKKRAVNIDISESRERKINVSKSMPEIKSFAKNKYGTSRSKGSSSSQDFDIPSPKKRSYNVASNSPNIGSKPSTKYNTVRRAKGAAISLENKKSRRQPMVTSPREIPSIKRRTSRNKYQGASKDGSSSKMQERANFVSSKKSKGSGSNRAKVLLPETAGIQNLSACADPTEEARLKRKILATVDYDGQYCNDKLGEYEFFNVDMISTMDIRFRSKKAGLHNRCDALNMALQCLKDN